LTLQNLFAIEPYLASDAPKAWFGVLTLALAIFINATMLSKILEIWTAFNKVQNDLDSRMNSIMSFLRNNGIHGPLRDDILDYFEFRYTSHNDLDYDKIILECLPPEMQSRVVHRIFPHALNASYLFSGASEGFVAQCVLRMSKNCLRTMPEQVICAQGSLGSEMYLLKRGSAEVSIRDSASGGKLRILGSISAGHCFGDISLWIESKRVATVTSTEYSTLFILTRHDLDEILTRFPEMATSLATNAIASCLSVTSLCPALEGISGKAAERLARRMAFSRLDFEYGDCIFEASAMADCAYVIRSGKVGADFCGGKLEVMSDLRCVGFTELLAQRPYQESLRALGSVQAYRLTASDVVELLECEEFEGKLADIRRSASAQFEHIRRVHLGAVWKLLVEEVLDLHGGIPSEGKPQGLQGANGSSSSGGGHRTGAFAARVLQRTLSKESMLPARTSSDGSFRGAAGASGHL